MTTLNRSAYQQMVDEDLAWLLTQPRTLERDHIEQIVRDSVAVYYPANRGENVERRREDRPASTRQYAVQYGRVAAWAETIPVCRSCRRVLTESEIAVSRMEPVGPDSRQGTDYCDSCWETQAMHAAGPEGTPGPLGLAFERVTVSDSDAEWLQTRKLSDVEPGPSLVPHNVPLLEQPPSVGQFESSGVVDGADVTITVIAHQCVKCGGPCACGQVDCRECADCNRDAAIVAADTQAVTETITNWMPTPEMATLFDQVGTTSAHSCASCDRLNCDCGASSRATCKECMTCSIPF